MFFSKSGLYSACNMFSKGHLVLLLLTISFITILLAKTKNKNKESIKKIIRNITIAVWILEIIKIVFNLFIEGGKNPNAYIPLYYCSIALYAGILSSFCKDKLERTGNVFIATGCIIGGLSFLIFPLTSLPNYPFFHYITFQSFIFHGLMLYLGILVNITGYIELTKHDIKYYALLTSIVIVAAYIVNTILGTNLMFISKNFPNTYIEPIYRHTGKFFTIIMSLPQIAPPFYVVFYIKKILKNLFVK